jgi:hypothetical protein
MTTYHYGQFSLDHLKAIREGITLFNKEQYWECHEYLEDLWLDDVGDKARLVYWAILQLSVCLYHYREENLIGAQGLMKKSKDKIRRCEKEKVETPLMYTFLDWDLIKKIVERIPDNPTLKDFETLSKFKFKPDPTQWRI